MTAGGKHSWQQSSDSDIRAKWNGKQWATRGVLRCFSQMDLALILALTLADRNVPRGPSHPSMLSPWHLAASSPYTHSWPVHSGTVAVPSCGFCCNDYTTRYKINAWNSVLILRNDNSFGVFGKKSVARTVGPGEEWLTEGTVNFICMALYEHY
jgi:hypothetical protein